MRQTCLQSVPARHYIFARLLIKGRVIYAYICTCRKHIYTYTYIQMRLTCLQGVPARHYIFARLLIKGRVHHFEIGKLLTILWIIREILNRTCRGELLYLGYPNLCQKSLIYTKRDLYTRYHTGDIHKTPKKVTCCSASLYPSHSKCVRRDLNINE